MSTKKDWSLIKQVFINSLRKDERIAQLESALLTHRAALQAASEYLNERGFDIDSTAAKVDAQIEAALALVQVDQ